MKRCTTCNRTYPDEAPDFCPQDGTHLVRENASPQFNPMMANASAAPPQQPQWPNQYPPNSYPQQANQAGYAQQPPYQQPPYQQQPYPHNTYAHQNQFYSPAPKRKFGARELIILISSILLILIGLLRIFGGLR